jgi:group II intron reverse transcriptase/maturase
MEDVCERANLKEALRQVRSNKGSAGVDGMTVDQLGDYLKQHWPATREQLLNGSYEPKPVRRVEIPKPDGGGMRKLGIPTVLDRFIQQAVMQVLQRRWNPTFSHHSYGFRPHRSAHQAVAQAQQYMAQGYGWVIDLDLEKFFDRVNHDKLMGQIAKRVEDKRLLKLIRAFLNAGVMENGLVSPSVEGTPQGGPLSPLLSNVVLDELDRELERRGHRFVRYADDCNIYVRSERAGQRVMEGITRFISQKLKLKVNKKERGGMTAGTQVSRVQLHGRSGHQAHDRAEISGTVQAANPGHHAQGQGRQYHDDNGRVGFVYAGLARLFRLLRNTPGAHRAHSLGPAATAGCSLAPVENTTAPPGGTGRKRGLDMGCKEHGWQWPRSLVSRPKQSPLHRALKCVLQIARSPIPVPSVLAQLLEPPCTDPYARWCGRGGAARLPPIPISGPKRSQRTSVATSALRDNADSLSSLEFCRSWGSH